MNWKKISIGVTGVLVLRTASGGVTVNYVLNFTMTVMNKHIVNIYTRKLKLYLLLQMRLS